MAFLLYGGRWDVKGSVARATRTPSCHSFASFTDVIDCTHAVTPQVP